MISEGSAVLDFEEKENKYNSEFIQWLPSYARTFRKVTANTKKGVLYYLSVKCVVLMDVQMNYANTDTSQMQILHVLWKMQV